jgi:hypothetical protein
MSLNKSKCWFLNSCLHFLKVSCSIAKTINKLVCLSPASSYSRVQCFWVSKRLYFKWSTGKWSNSIGPIDSVSDKEHKLLNINTLSLSYKEI